MKNHFIFLTILISCGISLFAQVAQNQADSIVKEYLQNEQIEYELLYVNVNAPNEDGITITTSNEEIFTAKYACWTYFVDETEPFQRRYLFIREEDGNILEVIANNDVGFDEQYWKPVETTSIIEPKENAISLIFPNPTTGELRIMNYELRDFEDIEIFDITAKKLPISKAPSPLERAGGEVIINISHLPTGMYFLKIKTEKGVITKKIIKMNH